MIYGSVCSGIEAASCAWNPLGWKAEFFSEIEPFPCSILKHHYPETINHGDMTKFKEWPDAAIDALVGGTPCQSFSVAGLRKGLDDPRGNLMLTFGAIAAKYRPEWLVWENVPGVLSSNGGKDFGTFLGMLAELGYGFAYRVLDAQYFGVAQRRRRVFVVARLGDWRGAAAVLFERHCLQGALAPSREAGQEVAGTLASRTGAGGFPGSDEAMSGYVQPVAFAQNSRDEVRLMGGNGSLVGALAAEAGMKQTCYVAQTVSLRGREGGATAELGGEVATALRASGGGGDKPHVLTTCVEVAGTMKACKDSGGWSNSADHAAAGYMQPVGMQVRRLTPKECERLQGFPDGYTQVPHRGKPAADGPRYKALGNSMAVPVMAWIGRRIQHFNSIEVA